jgi:predicted TIM-barrel fold metal-dependent hydrolase
MPFEDFVVCDSDMHVLEPADLWQRYIADEFKHAAPVGMTELKRDLRVKVKSQVLLKTGPVRPLKERGGSGIGWRTEQEAAYAEAEAKGWGPEAQLDAMAKEGVDLAVLFPSRGLFALTIDSSEQIGPDGLEPEYAAAIARAYNDWLHDFCAHRPDRLFGAAMVAPHHVPAAVDEVRRTKREYGFKAVFLQPGTVRRRPWHHRDYDPLWAACQEEGVALCFHGGGRTSLTPDFSLEVFADRLMMWHTFNQPLGVMAAAVSLTAGGVLERFPRLRERIGNQASTLSGGEQKQLEIGRALLLRPRVLLIDEPSIGLSPIIVADVFRLLRQLVEAGTTVLMVEQNVRSALKVSDRAIALDMGRMAIDRPAAELLLDPNLNRLFLGGAAGTTH